MTKSFAWSYSALSMFEQCRKKYYHIRVLKDVKDDDSQWAGDGKKIHDALYKRVVKGENLPLPMRYMEPMAARFAATPGEKHGELQLAINAKFEPVDWFADDAWCRAIIDFLNIRGDHALVVDWKTGKVREEFDQLKLSAAVLSIHMPELTKFRLAYVWTKHRHVSPLTMEKKHMQAVWTDYLERVKEITEATKTTSFPASPSALCKSWCPVKECPHNG